MKDGAPGKFDDYWCKLLKRFLACLTHNEIKNPFSIIYFFELYMTKLQKKWFVLILSLEKISYVVRFFESTFYQFLNVSLARLLT